MNPADVYLLVREKEGRLYPDQVVLHLPTLPSNYPHKAEWEARAVSANKLIRYIMRLHLPLFILELGCGNGWLSRRIGNIPGVRIWGLDRSGIELKQAARLFNSSNTGFLSTDIFRSPFIYHSFDLIILASVIQYFKDLPALIQNLQPLLTNRGEIHIIDSPIYERQELSSASERTINYYIALGFPEMADHYFHHSTDELTKFSTHWLYKPDRWQAQLARLSGKTTSPFPWLSIR
jgi:ubiquinone/menaquinone biosynthesis C-methylase UbiE